MTINVVVGPPCSGKSTFVQTHAAAGVARFDFDLVASTVAGTDLAHDIPQNILDPVMAMRRGLMGWLLDPEAPTDDLWLINAAPTQGTIESLVAVGAKFHVLDPGEEECIARAMRENRPEGTIDRIKNWYLSPPQIPEEKAGGAEMIIKNAEFSIKAEEVTATEQDPTTGEIVAYASVFGNIDSYGDVVMPGAFANTLEEWKASGRVIPLLYGHDFHDPFSSIGAVTEAIEDDHGLKITATIDLDNPKAAQVHKLIMDKRLAEMSFAFRVVEGGFGERDGEEVYEIRELKLFEVSVVPIGANSATEIVSAKSVANFLVTAAKQAMTTGTTDSKKSDWDSTLDLIGNLAGIAPESSAKKAHSLERERLALQIEIMERDI